MMNPTVLCIIPARGGSKGVLRKNIRNLNGKPLIAYTIETALQAEMNARIIVSTEDDEIADIAQKAGAEVPFFRPSFLAQDDTKSEEVIDHVLHTLAETECYRPDYIMLLQPTSPFRNTEDIMNSLSALLTQNCDAVVSVTQVTEHPLIMRKFDEKGCLAEVLPNPNKLLRRQDFPPYYRFNGAIYVTSIENWEKYRSFISMPAVFPYVMPIERSVDIDSEIDWKLAEIIMGGL